MQILAEENPQLLGSSPPRGEQLLLDQLTGGGDQLSFDHLSDSRTEESLSDARRKKKSEKVID